MIISPNPLTWKNSCSGFNCFHNGTCQLVNGQPQCLCSDSMYMGRQCEQDKCLSIFCRNGGYGHRMDGRCVCVCEKGFTGEKCENTLSEYLPCINCDNGGICRILNGTKVCQCSPEFAGPTCNIRVPTGFSPCKQLVCQNGGVCQTLRSNSGKYFAQCICDERFSGEYCQSINRCYKHCLNGGTCFSDGSSVRCHCTPGWTGGRCALNFGDNGKHFKIILTN